MGDAMVVDSGKKATKRKRVELVMSSEEREARIDALREEIDGLIEYYKEFNGGRYENRNQGRPKHRARWADRTWLLVSEVLVHISHILPKIVNPSSSAGQQECKKTNTLAREWGEGQVTEYLVATFDNYFTNVKMYIEERSFRRFVESCLEQTVIVYVDHLLSQKNYIKEETIEGMRLDEEVLMDFFREYISVDKVENRLRILIDLRELASAESPDAFTLAHINILEHQPDCPPDVVEKIVGLREGIPRKDAKEGLKPGVHNNCDH